MMNKKTEPSTAWHRLLGEVLEKLLSPVGLLVYTELPVMNKPPKADILILRREQAHWTKPQLQRLADGLRDSQASHLLLEFKYTESLTEKAFQQASAYDFFYKQTHELKDSEVQTFLLIAKQPQTDRLTEFGYVETSNKGVYRSELPLLRQIILLSLNELSDAPHNAFIKCFATQQKEKRKAFEALWRLFPQWNLSKQLIWTLDTLWGYWFSSPPGGDMKRENLTSKELTQANEETKRLILASMTIGEVLRTFRPKDVVAHLKPEDVLAHVKPEDLLAHVKSEDLLAHVKPEDLLAHVKSEDLLAHVKPEDLLAHLKLEDIENYLNQRKQNHNDRRKPKSPKNGKRA